jgi:hypothetical protein
MEEIVLPSLMPLKSSPSRWMIGTTPDVDTVTRRFERAMPSLSVITFSAFETFL